MIDADVTFPISGVQRLCFLKNIIDVPNVEVGDYTYYDDPDDVQNFMDNILYHFDFIGDKLIVGKFCQIATGVRFIMNVAIMHWMDFLLSRFGHLVASGLMCHYILLARVTQRLVMMCGLVTASP